MSNPYDLDEDIDRMNAAELKNEIRALRTGIRRHRDSQGHDLCWFVPELWNLLPEKVVPSPAVPEFSEFIQNCCKYRKSLDKK